MTQSTTTARPSADVIVIGGGVAGATAAAVIGQMGLDVILLDQRPHCPPCFKAEKIEPHQAELFRKFGLMEALLPLTGRVRTIHEAKNGRVFKTIKIEQYGILYHDMVNAIRDHLPPRVTTRIGKVRGLALGEHEQRVLMDDNVSLSARLVIDACGTSTSLTKDIGIQREWIEREQSVAFGFNLRRADDQPFFFDSLTYYPDVGPSEVAYLTLFPIGKLTRANLFAFWPPRDPRTRRLQQDMQAELPQLFPKLANTIGKFVISSKVEVALVDLYETTGYLQPGIVLIGDAFQSVCPTTATGLSKVLTDVDVLCNECLPGWFATPGMPREKLETFYSNQRKRAVDRHSLGGGSYQRAMAVERSLAWRLRRTRKYWQMTKASWQHAIAGQHGEVNS